MMARGHDRNAEECRTKAKMMRLKFKEVFDHNQTPGNTPKTCSFYKELEAILRRDANTEPARLSQSLPICWVQGNEEGETSVVPEVEKTRFPESIGLSSSLLDTQIATEVSEVEVEFGVNIVMVSPALTESPQFIPVQTPFGDHEKIGVSLPAHSLGEPEAGISQKTALQQDCYERLPPSGTSHYCSQDVSTSFCKKGLVNMIPQHSTSNFLECPPSVRTVGEKEGKNEDRQQEVHKRGKGKDIMWKLDEIRDLLDIWGQQRFQDVLQVMHMNIEVFEEIASEMMARGHDRNAEECRTRAKMMQQTFKEVLAHNNISGNAPRICPFYKELEVILLRDAGTEPVRLSQSLPIRWVQGNKEGEASAVLEAEGTSSQESIGLSPSLLDAQIATEEAAAEEEFDMNIVLVSPALSESPQSTPVQTPFGEGEKADVSLPADPVGKPEAGIHQKTALEQDCYERSSPSGSSHYCSQDNSTSFCPRGLVNMISQRSTNNFLECPSSVRTVGENEGSDEDRQPEDKRKGKLRGKIWRLAETRALLDIWGQQNVQEALQVMHRNLEVFEEIADEMMARGHDRNAEECRAKVKMMRLKFKEVLAHNKKSGNAPKTCLFYKELEAILLRDASSEPARLSQSLPIRWVQGSKGREAPALPKVKETWSQEIIGQTPSRLDAQMATEDARTREEFDVNRVLVSPGLTELPQSTLLRPSFGGREKSGSGEPEADINRKTALQQDCYENIPHSGTSHYGSQDISTSSCKREAVKIVSQHSSSNFLEILPSVRTAGEKEVKEEDREEEVQKKGRGNGIRWNLDETLDLLDIWGKQNFQDDLKMLHMNIEIYEEIATEMRSRGHDRNAEECRAKAKMMRLKFKEAFDHNKISGNAPRSCSFYEELEVILRRDASTEPAELTHGLPIRWVQGKEEGEASAVPKVEETWSQESIGLSPSLLDSQIATEGICDRI
uniref:Myb/SANT-like DNA-binding domain-containing protein n=1 Tax=Anolis carolinensis TaxID=28377 RepID=A0A803TTZ2_ANOCA